jgi:opacity protein-like surface antigen
MKLHTVKKGIYSSIFLALFANSALAGHASVQTIIPPPSHGKFYVGIFGGGGSTRSFDVSQYGTAYFFEELGGPLAVDAFGDTNNRSAWLFGAQVGYQASEIILHPCYQWGLVPAAEMETYYFGERSFSGHLVNDEATRLDEHDFDVSYDVRRSIFLANVVFNLNIPCVMVHPYVGLGFGAALVKISGADATQVSPPEPGVNHYNSNTGDTDPTFAGQVKVGLSYDFNPCVSVFAEYRWLYLSSSHFVFGSTIAPGHAATSAWQVKFDPHYTNIGTVGIRLNLL